MKQIVFIARTQAEAVEHMSRTTLPWLDEKVHIYAVGVCGSIHSTPDQVFMCGDINFNHRVWDWFTHQVLGAREIRWVLQ